MELKTGRDHAQIKVFYEFWKAERRWYLIDRNQVLKVLAAQSCLTLCNPMDCSPPGSSVYGILQARILEWVAISYFKGSSQPRDRT